MINGIQGPGMLLIYGDWCPHCRAFKPVYAQLDSVIGNTFPLLAIEDKDASDALMNSFNSQGVPTLKFFNTNGLLAQNAYTGTRDVDSMLKYICTNYHRCVSGS